MNTVSTRRPQPKPPVLWPRGSTAPPVVPAPRRTTRRPNLTWVSPTCTMLGLTGLTGLVTAFAFGVPVVLPFWLVWLGCFALVVTGEVAQGRW
jgi:hypothetical protein